MLCGDAVVAINADSCLKLSGLPSESGWESGDYVELKVSPGASDGGGADAGPRRLSARSALEGWELLSWCDADGLRVAVAGSLVGSSGLQASEASFHPRRGLSGRSAAVAAAAAAAAEGDTFWPAPAAARDLRSHCASRCPGPISTFGTIHRRPPLGFPFCWLQWGYKITPQKGNMITLQK